MTRIAVLLEHGLAAVALVALSLDAGAAEVLNDARDLKAAGKWKELVELVERDQLERVPAAAEAKELDELLATGLLNLGRKDEAAHYFDRAAAAAWTAAKDPALQQLVNSEVERLRGLTKSCDPLSTEREQLLADLSKDLYDSAKRLADAESFERALDLLVRIEPAARGEQLAAISALAEKLRGSTQGVNLDVKGGMGRPADGWPQVTVESKRYTIVANLEPKVAETLGRTMDEIYDYYVRIYFDGDESRIDKRKVTLRIHPTQPSMFGDQKGPPGIGGWWAQSDWTVTSYDTRTDWGTLDQMLDTLFHEASHHFMSMLAKEGFTPAWLNEGTAAFFEGAQAMADGRVLWPDASALRLKEFEMLVYGQGAGMAPKLEQVVGYDKPGSYPPPYYAFGWALVYFMQQYEDPTTFEYVYRPLYNRYRDQVIKAGKQPREIFEQVFLGAQSPLQHATLADFDKFWRGWIHNKINPLHVGDKRRALRMAEVQRYLDAAQPAPIDKKTKKPIVDPNRKIKIPEQELLLRALGHIEFVRTKIDKADEPDPKLLLLQADVLERAGRGSSAAPILEQLLELADAEQWEGVTPAQFKELEKRLDKLDRKNAHLRVAKVRMGKLAKRGIALLDQYAKAQPALPLRSYSLATVLADALDDPKGLGVRAEELRVKARDAGLLKSSKHKLEGPASTWATIFSGRETLFEPEPDRIRIESVAGIGRLCTLVPISGEYELRARLTRTGEAKTTQQHGLVFSGTPGGDWMAISLDKAGKLILRRMAVGAGSGASDVGVSTVNLKNPPAMEQPFELKIHVFPAGDIEVSVGDEGPFPLHLPQPLPSVGHVGVYVKNGGLLVENAIVEIQP